VKGPVPGRLYRSARRGLFVPIHCDETRTGEGFALWCCLTSGGIETLWLWNGTYHLVEEA
jgi:hypothetical protein